MSLFGRAGGRPPPDKDARSRVEAWARSARPFPAGTALRVGELLCPDPACPGLETVILVMVPGARTRACKVAKPLAEVSRADVAAALEAMG